MHESLTGATVRDSQGTRWKCVANITKEWKADEPEANHYAGDIESVEFIGNTLLNGGASIIWERLITLKPATGTSGAALQGYSSGNAAIGVGGTSSVAAAVTQTDMQATAGGDRYIQAMSTASYPSHTDGTSSSGMREVQFQSIFTTSQANFAWGEWGIFNDPHSTDPDGARSLGRMLNRKVEALGTKTSAAVWTFTATLGLS